MKIEVDQSGKIEDTATDTVIAFSNEDNYSVLIKAATKRSCLHNLRKRGKTGKSIYRKIFSVGLYLLLKNHIKKNDSVIIDVEYSGRSDSIKENLINLFKSERAKISSNNLRFTRIGRKSNAHNIAYLAHRKVLKVGKIIGEEDLMKYL